MNHLPQAAIDLIKHYESCRLTAYMCPAGVPTIGWGHTKTVTRADVDRKKTITAQQAEALLREDIGNAETAVRSLVRVPLTDGQYGALVSFAFNLGFGALSRSTLLCLLNAGDYDGAAAEFLRWVKANGEVMPGLVKRRADEVSLWNGGYDLP